MSSQGDVGEPFLVISVPVEQLGHSPVKARLCWCHRESDDAGSAGGQVATAGGGGTSPAEGATIIGSLKVMGYEGGAIIKIKSV